MDKKKKTTIIVGVIVALLLVIIGVLIFLLLKEDEPEPVPSLYTMDENNYQQIMETMDAEVEEGYFETYMNTEWTFPDGASKTADAVLGNSPNNTKPIRCEVELAETGDVIYKTGVLPVGAVLDPFQLDKDLDAGTYGAVCRIYLLDEAEDGTYTDYSNAGFNITITVEN